MRVTSTPVFLATSICLSLSSAIPLELQRRAAGAQSDPKQITIDCTNGEDVCNDDCYSILCFNSPNPVQYMLRNDNRGSDGNSEAALRLVLQNPNEGERQARGVNISQDVINQIGTSPEETIMNNAEEGGEGEIMMDANFRQNSFGARVGGQLRSQGVSDGQYYYKTFTNYGSPNPSYCAALQSNPPDTSICTQQGKADTDPSKIAMVKLEEPLAGGKVGWHMMNWDAGDRWSGHNWPGGMKKREEQTEDEA
ncbi:hypothetical protein EV356DRAFT_555009 [Viridothelium virens]|uniref:Uncharacterized protein n=1 Tax=Viridothelium virens TaxID=1048519 RepID=A0A6A6GW82_VIRVR|nr:hypothetical protein EV356DRAFT_555009 [Viridothelium virens]